MFNDEIYHVYFHVDMSILIDKVLNQFYLL